MQEIVLHLSGGHIMEVREKRVYVHIVENDYVCKFGEDGFYITGNYDYEDDGVHSLDRNDEYCGSLCTLERFEGTFKLIGVPTK